jgi:hypothetical protein
MMGLLPHEFYDFSLQEYLLKQQGFIKAREITLKQDFFHWRYMVHQLILMNPYISKADKAKPFDMLVPDVYERIKADTETIEDTRARLIEQYKKHGVLK